MIFIDNLGVAIVQRAYMDYKRMLRRCKTWEHYKADQSHEKQELECFFRSGLCSTLTGGNGPRMMQHAQNEVLRGKKHECETGEQSRKT